METETNNAKHDTVDAVAISTFDIAKFQRFAQCCRMVNTAEALPIPSNFITFLFQCS